jgi:hypothetical protein
VPAPDHRAEAVHAARAERHWSDARRFRALGLELAARQATIFAEDEERIAALLRGRAVKA